MNLIFKRRNNPFILQNIPISKLSVPSPVHRKNFDNYEISQLAENIRLNGVLEPLDVIEASGEYRIVSGVRRHKAAVLLGLETLPCRLLPYIGTYLLKPLIESRYTRTLTVFEEAEYINELLNLEILTAGEVAEALNLTNKGLEDCLNVLKFTADERKIILKENVTSRQMKSLLRLHDEIMRFKALEEVVEKGLSPLDTERYVESVLNPTEAQKAEIRQSTAVFLDKRVLDNTFKKVIATAEKSGIKISFQEAEDEDNYEYIFRLPKNDTKTAEMP